MLLMPTMFGRCKLDILTAEHAVKLLEDMCTAARADFELHGEVAHTVLLVCTRDPQTLEYLPPGEYAAMTALPSFDTVDEKEAVMSAVRTIASRLEAVAYVCTAEAWAVRTDKLDAATKAGDASLSEHPDKEEVVFIALEHREVTALRQAKIHRENGLALLAPFEAPPGSHGATGRMFNVLTPPISEGDA